MRFAIAAGAIAIVLLGSYLLHHTEPRPPLVADDPPPPPSLKASAPQPIAKIDHAQQLATKAERQQLAEQIAAAQTTRKAHAARPPSIPTLDTQIRPAISECYREASSQLADRETRIIAKLTLVSDPDVGTIVEARQLSDDQGRPLLATFDDCLRNTIGQLALPPVADGGTIEVTYPLTFHK